MATFEIPDKDLETNIDRSADTFLIYDDSASKLVRTNVNSALNITGDPVGTSDSQVLTNKTIPAYEPVKGADDNYVTDAEKTKLTGIEAGAEVNNISDVNATDLTDGGATTLHKHSYSNLDNLPTLGTAAAKNIPATGNASATEVVYGSDTRLTDARTPTSHDNTQHSATYITAGDIPVIPDSVDDLSPSQTGNNGKFLKTDGTNATWESIPGGGDMLAATYDPTSVSADAFDMDNMVLTDNTTNDASTTAHGLLLKATAPAAGLYNYVGITNGETAYTNKALFDATDPSTQAFGDSASAGSAAVAARRDHKHAMPAAITRDSLGLDTDDSPQFAGINIGHASDTTISRVSAGKIAVEGVNIPTISSTDTLTNKTYESPSFVNWNGWVSPNETWTYASASSFTVSGDTTSKYQIGDKILITQTTDKYFIITNVVYSSPNTTVTVDGFGIYTLANAEITANSYSKMETPQGFPRKEVLLFSGTPAASVTLSETYAHFDFLDIWYEGNNDGGITGVPYYYTRLSAAIPDVMAVAVDLGYLDSTYKIRTSGGIITASGTTVSITGYGTNYSTETIAGSSSVVFTDTQFIPKITRVVGIRW